jgi:hypothetical protein
MARVHQLRVATTQNNAINTDTPTTNVKSLITGRVRRLLDDVSLRASFVSRCRPTRSHVSPTRLRVVSSTRSSTTMRHVLHANVQVTFQDQTCATATSGSQRSCCLRRSRCFVLLSSSFHSASTVSINRCSSNLPTAIRRRKSMALRKSLSVIRPEALSRFEKHTQPHEIKFRPRTSCVINAKRRSHATCSSNT